MNRETLRYHLDQLDACGRVIVLRDRGIVRYFENHGRYSPLERQILAHSRNPTAGAVLSLIDTEPGITRAGIARQLAVTPPTVRWYLQRFAHDGIVTPRRRDRHTCWYLTDEAAGAIHGSAGDEGSRDGSDAAIIAP
jgi:predicted transcriptional regulator